MKKIISFLLLLFLLVGMVPSPGFCEDKKKDNATAGAATAGAAAGEETFIGMHKGTIVFSTLLLATIAICFLRLGGNSTTTTNH